MTSQSLTIKQRSALVAVLVASLACLARARPAHIQQDELSEESASYHKHTNSPLHVHRLAPTSNNITCNDGSPVGYYKRLNSRSKSWVIYLQGGGFCGSEESCQQRWLANPQLMSSNFWPKTKTVEGILSNEQRDNPHLWNANHVYVPYCSSDSWTGLARASAAGQFSFMGSKIIERVLDSLYDDLPPESSLHEAKFILLAGDSAGATGVILNLDKVGEIIEKRTGSIDDAAQYKQAPVLRGLADSGWFLDNEPYDLGSGEAFAGRVGELEIAVGATDCDRNRCTPSQSIKQAMAAWNGQLPAACANQYQVEPWRCYFAYRAYQTLKTPLFVVQWLYDEAQLLVDNIARPDTSGQWNYVNKVVHEMRTSLQNVTALFAPSCFSHSLVTRRSWNQINIDGFKLPHVLNSWQLEQQSILETTTAINRRRMSMKSDESLRFVAATLEHSLATRQVQTPPTNITGSQSTLDTQFSEQEQPTSTGLAPTYARDAAPTNPDHRLSQAPKSSTRPRTRKRKRNNQQHRSKQTRQKSSQNTADAFMSAPAESTHPAQRESNDLASSTSLGQDPSSVDRSAAQDLLLGRQVRHSTSASSPSSSSSSPSNNLRPGRATIVDDTSLMLSNNVPDDNTNSQQTPSNLDKEKTDSKVLWMPGSVVRTYGTVSVGGNGESPATPIKHPNMDRFRLIDSCGWPQCNRDCPVLDLDFN